VTGVSLVAARSGHTSVVSGNYVHVIAGIGGSALGSVERAAIDASGNVGTFSTVTGVTVMTPRVSDASSVIGNNVYVVGGSAGGGTYLDSVERATINTDGTLGTFSTVTGVSLMTPRFGHTSAAIGNYLYLAGGTSGSFLTSIESALLL
jgi:hypothetical protein